MEGLDRKINLWDLNGGGQKLSIDVGEDEAGSLSSKEKGSVYALAATTNMVASGGPESTVRVWDNRTGKRITKLVGHTDNIRDVLISQDGTTIMTASSDRTVKVWSTVAGRCMFTLTMHDASVWSLFSKDPDLSIFYSSDKNGLIARTDTRNTIELDEGLSVAVAQEHEGVHRVVSAGDCLWTATSRPSINRWRDVNTDNADIDVPENYTTPHRSSIASTRVRIPSPTNQTDAATRQRSDSGKKKIPLKYMLRMSNTAYFPTPIAMDGERKASVMERTSSRQEAPDVIATESVRSQPDFAIEGQNGLIKHVMLNDRKRVLTLDTASEVVMWDLLECAPVKSFGKRDIDDVRDEVMTAATVANWCTVDTRTGSLAVVLDENTCFDAEMYADELDLDEEIEFREDQRINLGKWVLRYLFSNLIAEEIRRDEAFRKQLLSAQEEKMKSQGENAPGSIQIPQAQINGWHQDEASAGPQSGTTLRRTNGPAKPSTPGLAIGQAPSAAGVGSPVKATNAPLSATEDNDKDKSITAQPRQSTDRASSDYFAPSRTSTNELAKAPVTPNETGGGAAADDKETSEGTPKPETTPGKEAGLFGKKFSMRGMSFGSMKKIGRSQIGDRPSEKPSAVVEEKEEGGGAESDSRSSKTSNSRVVDENLWGTVQKMRFGYEDSLAQQVASQQQGSENSGVAPVSKELDLASAITPSLPSETPVLKPPLNTILLIQEERPEAGGVADLFEGTVASLSQPSNVDLVEKNAPMWVGEVLLRNLIPQKEVVKISFILEPEKESGLPGIGGSDGNNRLNANRMLRARKILGYVCERIEPQQPQPPPQQAQAQAQQAKAEEESEKDGDGDREGGEEKLKPEEYLELWCQNQVTSSHHHHHCTLLAPIFLLAFSATLHSCGWSILHSECLN